MSTAESEELAALKQKLRISRDAYRMVSEILDIKIKDAAMWRAAYWEAIGEKDPSPPEER